MAVRKAAWSGYRSVANWAARWELLTEQLWADPLADYLVGGRVAEKVEQTAVLLDWRWADPMAAAMAGK